MGGSEEEYIDEYYRVRRRKDAHLADSSNDPAAKWAMLFDDGNGLVTHAELRAVDEDGLHERYSAHNIEHVYVEEIHDEVAELKRIAAEMYGMVKDTHDIYDCLEPTGDEAACPPTGCEDCGWCRNWLRDDLLRLGVDI